MTANLAFDRPSLMWVMGKPIGIVSGWDEPQCLVMHDLYVNVIGRRFVPAFVNGYTLVIDFVTGTASMFGVNDDTEIALKVDWSAFNR